MSADDDDLQRFLVCNHDGKVLGVGLSGKCAATFIESFNESMRGTGREAYALPVRIFVGNCPIPPAGPFYVPNFIAEASEQC